jgi:hypothetical protein
MPASTPGGLRVVTTPDVPRGPAPAARSTVESDCGGGRYMPCLRARMIIVGGT